MARRKQSETPLPFWEIGLFSWTVSYHFGASQRTKHFPDQFSEISTVDLEGSFIWPAEWKGIDLTASLRGSRDLETFLRLGYPPEKLIFPSSSSDHELTHVGVARPVLKTRLPKAVHMDITLPHDMIFKLFTSFESGVVRTMQVFSAGVTKGDPKAHWIRSVTFQRDPDDNADVPTS
ncbi:MAG: hypothetical protein ABL932_10675 [Terricaulis sp.]